MRHEKHLKTKLTLLWPISPPLHHPLREASRPKQYRTQPQFRYHPKPRTPQRRDILSKPQGSIGLWALYCVWSSKKKQRKNGDIQ